MHRHRRRPACGTNRPWGASGALVLAAAVVTGGVVVDRLTPRGPTIAVADGHADACLALAVVADSLLRDRVPPPNATPEQEAAVSALNVDLQQMRAALFDLNGIRQLGCRGED